MLIVIPSKKLNFFLSKIALTRPFTINFETPKSSLLKPPWWNNETESAPDAIWLGFSLGLFSSLEINALLPLIPDSINPFYL